LSDPVIIYFLGGPGVASISFGLFGGIGPLKYPNPDNSSLIENPYTWNKRANLLFIDNPAGVGYSYGDPNNLKHDLLHNDISSSDDVFKMIKMFYKDWPELLPNSIYTSGISYGGIYAPYLAWKMHLHNLEADLSTNYTMKF